MYELIVKILGEKDFKKYTIEEIEEMKKILENIKTEEVRLKRIERETTENNKSLRGEQSTEEARRRGI